MPGKSSLWALLLPQTLNDREIQDMLSKMKIPTTKQLSRQELLYLYEEHLMPKPQRKIFCKSSRKSISYSSEKSSSDKKCIKEQSLRKPISYSSSVKSEES